MCTVSRTECVVNVETVLAAEVCKSLCKLGLVLLFACVETNVLKKNAGTVLHSGDLSLSVVAYDIVCKYDLTVKVLVELVSNDLEGEPLNVLLSLLKIFLGSSCLLCLGKLSNLLKLLLCELEAGGENVMGLTHVRCEYYLRTLCHEVLDCGECFYDSLVGGDNTVLRGYVEVAANKNLSARIDNNVFNGLLVVGHFSIPPFFISAGFPAQIFLPNYSLPHFYRFYNSFLVKF